MLNKGNKTKVIRYRVMVSTRNATTICHVRFAAICHAPIRGNLPRSNRDTKLKGKLRIM
jgi:hypothetical protein